MPKMHSSRLELLHRLLLVYRTAASSSWTDDPGTRGEGGSPRYREQSFEGGATRLGTPPRMSPMADVNNVAEQDPHVLYEPPPDHPVMQFEQSAQRAMSEVINYDVDRLLEKGRGSNDHGVSPTDVTRSGADLGTTSEEEERGNEGMRFPSPARRDAE